MPSAPAASTIVSFTPAAAPACSADADDMMSSAPDGAVVPMPMPRKTAASTTTACDDSATPIAAVAAPIATAVSPAPTTGP